MIEGRAGVEFFFFFCPPQKGRPSIWSCLWRKEVDLPRNTTRMALEMQLRAQARQKVDIAINDGESCETDSKRVASKAKTSKMEVIRQKDIQVAITISPSLTIACS